MQKPPRRGRGWGWAKRGRFLRGLKTPEPQSTPTLDLRSCVQSLTEIKALLESRGLSPRHRLGQNFLIDKNLILKLVDAGMGSASASAPGERRTPPLQTPLPPPLVLEIGPGTGALTEALLAHPGGARVVAVELDAGLAALLRERAPELLQRHPESTLTVVEGDCLADSGGREVNREALAALGTSEPFVLVANLPYAAGTPLMLALLTRHPARCRRLAVTIQREVADRLAAGPSTKEYGTLGIVAQAMARVTRIANLPPECFWPRPEVHSAMVLLEVREEPLTHNPVGLAAFCQRIFSQRRKQLGSILGRDFPFDHPTLAPFAIKATDRPEAVSVAGLAAMAEVESARGEQNRG